MIKEYLELGQITGTHGIRGELRVNPWCDSPEFAKRFKTLYFDRKGNSSVKVRSCRPHGNIILLSLYGVDTVEAAQELKNKTLYLKRSDAALPDGVWFIEELTGCTVFDADDTEKIYGTLSEVSQTGANDVWHISAPGAEYLIPAIKEVVIKTDVENNAVYIRPLKGIFDDAD